MDENYSLSKIGSYINDAFLKGEDESLIKSRKFEVSEATSFLSNIYEKVRNTIDFKDEHLIRRFAIHRFLRIYISSKSKAEDTAEFMLKDLLRGGYVDDGQIKDSTVEKIVKIASKYIYAKNVLNNLRIGFDQNKLWDWLLSVASSEIEKTFYHNYKPEIFINLMAKYVKDAVRDTGIDLSPEQEDMQVFIACHKALIRSDLSILRFHAMTILIPSFFTDPDKVEIEKVVSNLLDTKNYIDGVIKSKTQLLIYMQVRKLAAPFKVLEGTLETNSSSVTEILENSLLLKDKCQQYIENFYKDLSKKLSVRITRTLGYLLITKVALALIIETPIDLKVYGHVNKEILAFNTIVPIIVFYLIARRIKLPGKENNEKIHQVINQVIYNDKIFISDQDEKNFKRSVRNNLRDSGWLNYIYAILYFIVYGLIILFLNNLNFNIISIFLFLFFLSVLSFFAWNIRARCTDLQIIPRKEGVVESFLSVMVLPILKVGQVLSAEVARLNVFTLLFDFILEAPFKLIVQAVEELIDYLKFKHEEVIQN